MSLIKSVEHAYAVAAQFIVQEAKTIKEKVLPVLQKAEAQASTVEQITALVSPSAANIERSGFAVLGKVIKAIEDGDAATAGGLNIELDSQLVADIKAILPAVKAAAPPVSPARRSPEPSSDWATPAARSASQPGNWGKAPRSLRGSAPISRRP